MTTKFSTCRSSWHQQTTVTSLQYWGTLTFKIPMINFFTERGNVYNTTIFIKVVEKWEQPQPNQMLWAEHYILDASVARAEDTVLASIQLGVDFRVYGTTEAYEIGIAIFTYKMKRNRIRSHYQLWYNRKMPCSSRTHYWDPSSVYLRCFFFLAAVVYFDCFRIHVL